MTDEDGKIYMDPETERILSERFYEIGVAFASLGGHDDESDETTDKPSFRIERDTHV